MDIPIFILDINNVCDKGKRRSLRNLQKVEREMTSKKYRTVKGRILKLLSALLISEDKKIIRYKTRKLR